MENPVNMGDLGNPHIWSSDDWKSLLKDPPDPFSSEQFNLTFVHSVFPQLLALQICTRKRPRFGGRFSGPMVSSSLAAAKILIKSVVSQFSHPVKLLLLSKARFRSVYFLVFFSPWPATNSSKMLSPSVGSFRRVPCMPQSWMVGWNCKNNCRFRNANMSQQDGVALGAHEMKAYDVTSCHIYTSSFALPL